MPPRPRECKDNRLLCAALYQRQLEIFHRHFCVRIRYADSPFQIFQFFSTAENFTINAFKNVRDVYGRLRRRILCGKIHGYKDFRFSAI